MQILQNVASRAACVQRTSVPIRSSTPSMTLFRAPTSTLRSTGIQYNSPVSYVTVCCAAATEDAPSAEPDLSQSDSIFISNLSWGTDEDALGNHVSSEVEGLIRVHVMMRDGRSRGMAIAQFDSPTGAQTAVERLHETDLDGRTINVRIAEPRAPRTDRYERRERTNDYDGDRRDNRRERAPRREGDGARPQRDPETMVFVGNLPWDMGWQDVKDAFAENGHPVMFADVKKTPEGRSRGFAVVQMSDASAVDRAIQEMDQAEMGGRRISVRRFNTEPRE